MRQVMLHSPRRIHEFAQIEDTIRTDTARISVAALPNDAVMFGAPIQEPAMPGGFG